MARHYPNVRIFNGSFADKASVRGNNLFISIALLQGEPDEVSGLAADSQRPASRFEFSGQPPGKSACGQPCRSGGNSKKFNAVRLKIREKTCGER
jgi:hypothetical protein